MDEATKREIIMDAMQSVIRDVNEHRAERPRTYLVIISEETENKIRAALRLLEE
jgi:hypothetical protein